MLFLERWLTFHSEKNHMEFYRVNILNYKYKFIIMFVNKSGICLLLFLQIKNKFNKSPQKNLTIYNLCTWHLRVSNNLMYIKSVSLKYTTIILLFLTLKTYKNYNWKSTTKKIIAVHQKSLYLDHLVLLHLVEKQTY